jgi:hypothetical protein
MVVVPQLRGHKQRFTAHRLVGKQLRERRADLGFVAVPLSSVEVAKSHLDRCLDGISGLFVIGKRSPEPECRDLTAAVVQGEPVLT